MLVRVASLLWARDLPTALSSPRCRLLWPQNASCQSNQIDENARACHEACGNEQDMAALRREFKGDILIVQTQVNAIEQQLCGSRIEARVGSLEQQVFGAAGR